MTILLRALQWPIRDLYRLVCTGYRHLGWRDPCLSVVVEFQPPAEVGNAFHGVPVSLMHLHQPPGTGVQGPLFARPDMATRCPSGQVCGS